MNFIFHNSTPDLDVSTFVSTDFAPVTNLKSIDGMINEQWDVYDLTGCANDEERCTDGRDGWVMAVMNTLPHVGDGNYY